MNDFEIGQIFEGSYPPKAAMWCNSNKAYIEEIESVSKEEEYEELVSEAVYNEEGVEVTPAKYETKTRSVDIRRFKIVGVPEPTEEEKITALKDDYERTVEMWLSDFAATRGYKVSNMGAYALSEHPIYSVEAKYFVQLQCDTWDACYNVLNAVLAGEREIPTKEELYAELPLSTAQWPIENTRAEDAANM